MVAHVHVPILLMLRTSGGTLRSFTARPGRIPLSGVRSLDAQWPSSYPASIQREFAQSIRNAKTNMKRASLRFLSVSALSLLAHGCVGGVPLTTVSHVDLSRFSGTLYVIANIPTFLEMDAYSAVES